MHSTHDRPQLIDRLPFVPFVLYAIERFLYPGRDYTATTTLIKEKRRAMIQKTVLFHNSHNQLVHALRTEAEAYQLLNPPTAGRPAKSQLTIQPGSISFSRPFQPGKSLAEALTKKHSHWTAGDIFTVLNACIHQLQAQPTDSAELPSTAAWIARVPAWKTYLLLPVYAVMTLLRSAHQWRTVGQLVILFYKQWWLPDLFGQSLVLAHRDLSPSNIILHGSSRGSSVHAPKQSAPECIDWESCAYGEPETEIAMSSRLYFGLVSQSELSQWINGHIKTPAQQRRFLRLSSFYVLQFLASELTSRTGYSQAWQYSQFLLTHAQRFSPASRTAYEQLWYALLHTIALFQRIPIFKNIRALNTIAGSERVILCYHSISHHPWRFALPPEQFARHLAWLNQHANVHPLPMLLTAQHPAHKPQVALSFDDGYRDLLETATPLLKAHKLPATAFIIANPEHVDRTQLGTQLPLLSLSEVARLPKKIWTIGSHTLTHPQLSSMSDQQLAEELATSRITLAKRTKTNCHLFAYPQGVHTERLEQAVREAGYQWAFTTNGGAANALDTQPLTVDRVCIEQDMDEVELAALLTPLGLVFSRTLIGLLKHKARLISKSMRYYTPS